jgi:hypothetical protein
MAPSAASYGPKHGISDSPAKGEPAWPPLARFKAMLIAVWTAAKAQFAILFEDRFTTT